MKPHPNPPACYGGILIFAWPVSIIIGLMIQSFITAWGIDHRKRVFQKRHQQLARMQSRPRETREEARQRKFRYLYQVRTARGDIISQVMMIWNPTENASVKYFSFSLRILFQLCKNAYNSAVPKHHQNVRSKLVPTKEIHFAVIEHISQLYHPIRICSIRSR